MLPKKHRLNLRKESFFKKRKGLFFSAPLFGVSFIKEEKSQPARFAFLVSKKIDKRATRRNRVKRLLAAAIREFLPQIKGGIKMVFIAKEEILDKDFFEIKREVEKFLKKNSFLK